MMEKFYFVSRMMEKLLFVSRIKVFPKKKDKMEKSGLTPVPLIPIF